MNLGFHSCHFGKKEKAIICKQDDENHTKQLYKAKETWRAAIHGVAKSQTRLSN